MSDEAPDLEKYTREYDNFTEEMYNVIPEDSPNRPALWISTNAETKDFGVDLQQPLKGNYVHIKFIRPHESDDENPNIDVEMLAFFGFEGKGEHQSKFTTVELFSRLLPDTGFYSDDEDSEDGDGGEQGNEGGEGGEGGGETEGNGDGDGGGGGDGETGEKQKDEKAKGASDDVNFVENYIKFVEDFFSAAREYSGDQTSNKAAELINVTTEELKEFAARTNIANTDSSDMPVNNALILTYLNSIVHVFKIFIGYDVLDILEQPM